MSHAPVPSAVDRRMHRLFDLTLFLFGVAAAVALVAKGVNDARAAEGWPQWLELLYAAAVLTAAGALTAATWTKTRLRKQRVVLDDERTADTHLRARSGALVGVLAVQVPFLVRVQVPSIAQAQFTVAAALLTYGAVRLWLNRET
jgi:hypothetical protein